MNNVMKIAIGSVIWCIALTVSMIGQGTQASKSKDVGAAASKSGPLAAELAKAALLAHGGDKLRTITSLVLRGSVDITTTAFNQAIPATFAMIFSGEKYRLDLTNPFQPVTQVFDGVNTQTTVQNGFELPPLNRVGFIMLSKVGDPNFPVAPLPEGKKKSGFRITSPEGFYTDYFVDDKSGQLKGYESSYEVNGRVVTTSVAIDRCRNVDGVLVPEKFSQRFDLGQLTAYADFKAKDIEVNTQIADDVFRIRK